MHLSLRVFVGLFLVYTISFSQIPQLSEKARISVLTCAAGNELYSSFGHTAFRVQDPVLGIDIVYNYGTFDFNKPNFYLNFSKGKLIYTLSRKRFENFLYEYELEKRWVKEQILNLTQRETNQLFKFFELNYRPENRDYHYDPLFNNCSSIVGDILKEQFGNQIDFKGSHLGEKSTFRQLVRQYLPSNSWGAFGIDLAFGAVVDRKASVREHMFLPYYAMYQLRNTYKKQNPVVRRERDVLDYNEKVDRGTFITSPLFWFTLFLCFVIAITYLDKKHDNKNTWLDFILFFISGLAGVFILLLWLATDHIVTGQNFNFLWLMPLNLFVGFKVIRRKKNFPIWLSKYLWFALGSMALMLLLWVFKIQILSPLNIPLMLILAIRYLFLLKKI
ncbi:MAG: DUF4105 domain-containing protein [Bacteroidota bacterium]